MAKLTKTQRASLRSTLASMERAAKYLSDPTIYVCRAADIASNALVFSRPYVNDATDVILGAPKAKHLQNVTKEYGSDLCALQTAIDDLARFLAHN